MKTATSFSALLLLLVSTAAGDEKPNNDRDPWNGFGVGSWVIQTESFTRDGKTEVEREKQTRVAAKNPGSIELHARKEGKTPNTFDGEESTLWHIPGFDPALEPTCKLVNTSKQDLEIQGKKHSCVVKKYDLTRGEAKATVIFWYCQGASVPYRELGGPPKTLAIRPDVLRTDVDYHSKERSHKGSVRVVNLTEERKIGERKVVCVRQEGEFEIVEGGKKGHGKVTTYLSDDVPGREVEMIAEGEIGGTKIRRLKRIEFFEVVKEK